MATLRWPILSCGEWRGHAEHDYVHDMYGPVACPGRAFDHPPDLPSKVPGGPGA